MSFPFYAIFPTQISKKYSIVLCYTLCWGSLTPFGTTLSFKLSITPNCWVCSCHYVAPWRYLLTSCLVTLDALINPQKGHDDHDDHDHHDRHHRHHHRQYHHHHHRHHHWHKKSSSSSSSSWRCVALALINPEKVPASQCRPSVYRLKIVIS